MITNSYLLVDSRNGGRRGHGYYPRGIAARFSHTYCYYDCFPHRLLLLWLFVLPLPFFKLNQINKGFHKGSLAVPFKEGGLRKPVHCEEKDGRRREGETAGERKSPSRVEVPASNGTKPR